MAQAVADLPLNPSLKSTWHWEAPENVVQTYLLAETDGWFAVLHGEVLARV